MFIPKAPAVSQIFKILFQTGDIHIFVIFFINILRDVFFSRYVPLKSFSGEKNSG